MPQLPELFYALVVAQAFDVLLGTLWAWQQKRVHSGVAQRGMIRKVAVLLLAGFVLIEEQYLSQIIGVNISNLCLSYFILAEVISVVRYAALLGAPVPRSVRERLEEVQAELDTINRDKDGGGTGTASNKSDILTCAMFDWGMRFPPIWWLIMRGLIRRSESHGAHK